MGFESLFTAPQLTISQWKQAINYFENLGQFPVISREAMNEKPTVAYVFDAATRNGWSEDFLVVLEPVGVYLLFHVGTDQQQAHVTALLTECLHKAGITGIFEEL